MLNKKIIALGAIALSIAITVPAIAGTVFEKTVTGKSSETSYVYLGDGGRYLSASGVLKKGTAKAKRINTWAPDTTETTIDVMAGQWSQDSFTSQAYDSNGEVQSYYITWTSSSSDSEAIVRFHN